MALPLSESGVGKGDRNIWRKPVRRKDMEKIFKKSLALILSAALCLTALVGCLTVSAAEGDTTKPVYSVGSAEGAAGAEVEVVANFSEISNVCAHHVIFNFPAGLEVTAVKNAAGEPYAAFDNSGERFDYKLDVAEDGSTKVQFLDFVNWAAENLSTSDMSIHFTVKIAADAAANTEYPVTIAVQAADYAAENLLDVTLTNGKVTVKADQQCEHDWEFVSAVPATYDSDYAETAKGSINLKCKLCDEQISEELSFNVYSSLLTPSIDAGAETKILFSTRKDLIEKNGAIENHFIVIDQTYASGATNRTIRKTSDATVSTDGSNRTVYTLPIGVPAKQMVDNFRGIIYTCVNGTWYNGYVIDTSIKDLAMTVIKADSVSEKMKKLCANLLVMGSKAQNYFNYNKDSLADAELIGDYANYIDTTVPTLVKDDTNFNNPYQTGEVGFRTPNLAMEDAIMINYSILTNVYNGSEDLNNLKVVLTYKGTSGATITNTITDLSSITNGYTFTFGVAARYMRTPITATVYNGDTPVSAGVVFSVESLLVQAQTGAESLKDLSNAIINYSNAAAVAFAQ